jgi:regulator of RNase E activity RraA
MQFEPLNETELAALRQLTSPTVANAIEVFNIRPRTEGFMRPGIHCMFPELGPMVGYAVTATIRASVPSPGPGYLQAFNLWEAVLNTPPPRVVVLQDLDDPPGLGAFWGEVQANIYKALGCVGTVTSGGVRDLEEVRALGFQFFAATVSVSHAYVHVVEVGVPVTVGGLTVRPGDLLHGDRHGVVQIPHEVAREIPRAARELEARERAIIEVCRSPDFSVERLKEVYSRR